MKSLFFKIWLDITGPSIYTKSKRRKKKPLRVTEKIWTPVTFKANSTASPPMYFAYALLSSQWVLGRSAENSWSKLFKLFTHMKAKRVILATVVLANVPLLCPL